MLSANEVHWFYDIGYRHDFFEHCPTEPDWFVHSKCYCEPATSFGKVPSTCPYLAFYCTKYFILHEDYTEGSCIRRFLEVNNRTATSYLVTRMDEDL